MQLLVDLLRVNTPLIVLVEQDLGWARAAVLDVARTIGPRRLLEYNAAQGWSGTEGLMQSSGLPTIVNLQSSHTDPARYIRQFGAWLEGAKSRGGSVEDSPFFEGVAVLHDLYRDLDSPVVIRQLFDLATILPNHAASAVMILPSPLPPDHPLHGSAVQMRPVTTGARRHAELCAAFVEQMGPLAEGVDAAEVAGLLADLSVAAAEAVLRLVALRLIEAEEAGEKLNAVLAVEAARDAFRTRHA